MNEQLLSYDHCEGANGRQGREAVALTLVATAITATLEAGLDGRVRILAEAAGGISAARRATSAGEKPFVGAFACGVRSSCSDDGASAGMVVAVACLRLVQRQQDNDRDDQNLQHVKHQLFEHFLVLE